MKSKKYRLSTPEIYAPLRTRKEIEKNIRRIVPGIKEVEVLENCQKHIASISVKLSWWKWLAPGIIHFILRKRIERAFCDYGIVGVLYVISVS